MLVGGLDDDRNEAPVLFAALALSLDQIFDVFVKRPDRRSVRLHRLSGIGARWDE
jgi:hypothetical protein